MGGGGGPSGARSIQTEVARLQGCSRSGWKCSSASQMLTVEFPWQAPKPCPSSMLGKKAGTGQKEVAITSLKTYTLR